MIHAIVVHLDGTNPLDVELAADMLWELGVLAVEERPGGAGGIDLWSSVGEDATDITAAVVALGRRWPTDVVDVDERIAESWRAFATPSVVDDDLVIVPAWWDGDAPAGTVIRIDPGAAFGLGDHPTTRLTLRAARHVIGEGDQVLDVGCGSGVLSIAAIRFGASAAVAIDVAPAAVAATVDNATRNAVAGRVTVSTTPLAEIGGPFPVVLANVLAPELIAMADDLARVTAPGGRLVLSGLLAGRYDHVTAALAPMDVVGVGEEGGWVALTLAHPSRNMRSGVTSSASSAGR